MNEVQDKIMCPSAAPRPGATLLGLFNSDGVLSYLSPAMAIDQDFITTASEGNPMSQRFRFSSPCATTGCRNWEGGKCQVPDKVRELTGTTYQHDSLPECTIRENCRWFMQEGKTACGLCPIVKTEPIGA